MLIEASLHQDYISEYVISLAIKAYCSSKRKKEQRGRMTADSAMRVLRNSNIAQLNHLLPLFAHQFPQHSRKTYEPEEN